MRRDFPWEIKLSRAQTLINQLSQEVDQYFSREPARISWEITKENLVIVNLSISDFPSIVFSSLAGEIIHNIRSGLDSIVYEIICKKSIQKNIALSEKVRSTIQFPIYLQEEYFNQCKFLIPFQEETFYSDLKGFQPFNWGAGQENLESAKEVSRGHHLSLLQELSNKDKHRGINFIFIKLRDFVVVLPPKSKVIGAFNYSAQFMNNGRILSFFVEGGKDELSGISIQPNFGLGFHTKDSGSRQDNVLNQLELLLNQSIYYVKQLGFHLK